MTDEAQFAFFMGTVLGFLLGTLYWSVYIWRDINRRYREAFHP